LNLFGNLTKIKTLVKYLKILKNNDFIINIINNIGIFYIKKKKKKKKNFTK